MNQATKELGRSTTAFCVHRKKTFYERSQRKEVRRLSFFLIFILATITTS